ncbi:MAG: hypothetical protein LQ344_003315 [Seirophora lacunosa]|nr:MAG: hypothetical protein LQ344_003315 [Seirophora lacunosa]
MLPWVLFLKLCWLVLPWSTLGYPQLGRTHERTSIAADLDTRASDPTTDSNDYNSAHAIDRRAVRPPPGGLPSMINGPDGPEPDPSRPVLWYTDDPATINTTQGGPYGVYSRVRLGVGERVPFDFEYPPYTQKKIIIARGFLDDETREGYVSIWIFGHFLGDFYVDADKVFKFHVDLSLAQGYVSMFSEYCDPEARKDCVYFAVALDLPFRQHLKKQWLLFKIPHNDKVKQMDNPATTG